MLNGSWAGEAPGRARWRSGAGPDHLLPRVPGPSRAAEETCKGKRRQRRGVRGGPCPYSFRSVPFSDTWQWDRHRGSSSRGRCLAGARADTSLSLLDGLKKSVQRLHNDAGPGYRGKAAHGGEDIGGEKHATARMLPREFAHEFPAESQDSIFHPQRTPTDPCQKPSRDVTAIATTPATRPPWMPRQTRGTMQDVTPVIPHEIP